jgi:hypothetical protein
VVRGPSKPPDATPRPLGRLTNTEIYCPIYITYPLSFAQCRRPTMRQGSSVGSPCLSCSSWPIFIRMTASPLLSPSLVVLTLHNFGPKYNCSTCIIVKIPAPHNVYPAVPTTTAKAATTQKVKRHYKN